MSCIVARCFTVTAIAATRRPFRAEHVGARLSYIIPKRSRVRRLHSRSIHSLARSSTQNADNLRWIFQKRLLDPEPLSKLSKAQRAERLKECPTVARARQSAQHHGITARVAQLLHIGDAESWLVVDRFLLAGARPPRSVSPRSLQFPGRVPHIRTEPLALLLVGWLVRVEALEEGRTEGQRQNNPGSFVVCCSVFVRGERDWVFDHCSAIMR
eukprot:scaffold13602_cov131-Isochrysis_galbana.AAC.2